VRRQCVVPPSIAFLSCCAGAMCSGALFQRPAGDSFRSLSFFFGVWCRFSGITRHHGDGRHPDAANSENCEWSLLDVLRQIHTYHRPRGRWRPRRRSGHGADDAFLRHGNGPGPGAVGDTERHHHSSNAAVQADSITGNKTAHRDHHSGMLHGRKQAQSRVGHRHAERGCFTIPAGPAGVEIADWTITWDVGS